MYFLIGKMHIPNLSIFFLFKQNEQQQVICKFKTIQISFKDILEIFRNSGAEH